MALSHEEVGARITEARKAHGWTHDQFRVAVNERLHRTYNLRTVQRWQKGRDPSTGKSWLPRTETLLVIADVLEVPTGALVEAASRWERLLGSLERLTDQAEANQELLDELLRHARAGRES